MSDRLPREPRERALEINLQGLLLGCALLGITIMAIGLGVISYRDRLKLRRQDALLAGAQELVQILMNLRGETSCPGNVADEGG